MLADWSHSLRYFGFLDFLSVLTMDAFEFPPYGIDPLDSKTLFEVKELVFLSNAPFTSSDL